MNRLILIEGFYSNDFRLGAEPTAEQVADLTNRISKAIERVLSEVAPSTWTPGEPRVTVNHHYPSGEMERVGDSQRANGEGAS